jgi:hypothetical protein
MSKQTIEHPLQVIAAPLTAVLKRLAIDIVEAQKTLDALAEAQAKEAIEQGASLPPLAFYFPDIELDLQMAFSVTSFQGATTLSVAPANPAAGGFFQTASFSSRLRARIAPRAMLVPPQQENE